MLYSLVASRQRPAVENGLQSAALLVSALVGGPDLCHGSKPLLRSFRRTIPALNTHAKDPQPGVEWEFGRGLDGAYVACVAGLIAAARAGR